jgi:hypothetical protein
MHVRQEEVPFLCLIELSRSLSLSLSLFLSDSLIKPLWAVLLTLELDQRGAFGQGPTDCAFARPLFFSLPEGPKRQTLPV